MLFDMGLLTTFSFRIPKSLARSIAAEARRSGVSKSEYTRRAVEAFNQHRMQERMAALSLRLSAHSTAAADDMESAGSDGFV